ncbi:MAG TPA: 50S ribosomal protein L10 [Gemmatimonadaceae bacterium]|nr:50S ribosomal protein L10 [Gemmatimonadaceae bacterium]
MKRSEKEEIVTELADKIKSAKALYYTDFTGLNVKHMTELRRRFRRAGVEYVVVKNTLALRAAAQSGLAEERLRGPTGVVIGMDPVTAAKVLDEFARENEQKPGVKGGVLDGKVIEPAQVKQLATLPSREQMLSQLAGGFQSPMAGFVGALNGLLSMFTGALEALRAQREGAES